MALVRARNGTKPSAKKAARTAGFQCGGMVNREEESPPALLSLIAPGKVHTLVHVRDLLAITIEHLGLDAIGIK